MPVIRFSSLDPDPVLFDIGSLVVLDSNADTSLEHGRLIKIAAWIVRKPVGRRVRDVGLFCHYAELVRIGPVR